MLYPQLFGATELTDYGQLRKEDIEALGLKVVEAKTPVEIVPGAHFTGNIERVASYEKVPANFQMNYSRTKGPGICSLRPVFASPRISSAQPAKADIAPGSHSSPSLIAQGFLAVLIRRGEKIEQDTFPGEQAVFFNVKG